MRYRVELDELLAFVDRLQAFEQRAEEVAARVNGQVDALHTTWSGGGAEAHQARHSEWMAAAAQMGDALAQLRSAAHHAHHNYTDAAQLNLDMLR
ncbi:WXG100 family type VII secretion target [Mycobacterium sp. SMC-4]|uniref:WXG100 family type VII secretion target n=1 Tax=Mycobacterium sp. SMC-4 TaxID=2857059 RepID=UPI0021B262F2|nr:WXG100 family type VII secretion target [Mycobacterium sp. SMC-4]UXA20548.1 WXG100 family type VII secretion target [Mycobacterium sp. SMC-4]